MENICFPLAVDILWFNYLPDLSLRTLHRIYHRRTGRESWMNYAQGDIISLLAAVFISHSALAGLPLAMCKTNIRYQFVRPVHVTNNANWFTVCVPHKTPSKKPGRLSRRLLSAQMQVHFRMCHLHRQDIHRTFSLPSGNLPKGPNGRNSIYASEQILELAEALVQK